MPRVYSKHRFTKAVIEYRDSTAEEDKWFGCAKAYDRDNPWWSGNCRDEGQGLSSLSGESGTQIITATYNKGYHVDRPDDFPEKFSGFRLYNGTPGMSITITKVRFVE